MNRLQGKIAVITGGTSGIGLAAAEAFLREGARVVVTGRDQKNADQAKDLLAGDAVTVARDVSKLDELDALATTPALGGPTAGAAAESQSRRERRPWPPSNCGQRPRPAVRLFREVSARPNQSCRAW